LIGSGVPLIAGEFFGGKGAMNISLIFDYLGETGPGEVQGAERDI